MFDCCGVRQGRELIDQQNTYSYLASMVFISQHRNLRVLGMAVITDLYHCGITAECRDGSIVIHRSFRPDLRGPSAA